MSKYVFRGRLCGTLCGDCFEPLSGVRVRLYRLRADQNAATPALRPVLSRRQDRDGLTPSSTGRFPRATLGQVG